MIWAGLLVLLIAAGAMIMAPARRAHPISGSEVNLSVYRRQLEEIDADVERGLISANDADAARLEVKRRILALSDNDGREQGPHLSLWRRAGLASVVCGVAVAVYASMGRPMLPEQYYDRAREREAEAIGVAAEVDKMIAKLEARTKAAPQDAQAWRALGWAKIEVGRISEAVEALRKAVALEPRNGPLLSQFGEALVRLDNGTVDEEAEAAFQQALTIDPKDPRARYYRGLALFQKGRERDALSAWIEILRDGPADAEWLPAIRRQVIDLAKRLGVAVPAELSAP